MQDVLGQVPVLLMSEFRIERLARSQAKRNVLVVSCGGYVLTAFFPFAAWEAKESVVLLYRLD